jgi:hypothetical protein
MNPPFLLEKLLRNDGIDNAILEAAIEQAKRHQ